MLAGRLRNPVYSSFSPQRCWSAPSSSCIKSCRMSFRFDAFAAFQKPHTSAWRAWISRRAFCSLDSLVESSHISSFGRGCVWARDSRSLGQHFCKKTRCAGQSVGRNSLKQQMSCVPGSKATRCPSGSSSSTKRSWPDGCVLACSLPWTLCCCAASSSSEGNSAVPTKPVPRRTSASPEA